MAELLDKLSARLAFERAGVRLYDAMIQKRDASLTKAKPTKADLQHSDEELERMRMLEQCILDLEVTRRWYLPPLMSVPL
jgi:hypothetical protein